MTKPTMRPSLRLYCDDPLVLGTRIALSPDHCHYLMNVMRRGSGHSFGLFNPRDGEVCAQLEKSGKKSAFAHLQSQVLPPATPPVCQIHLLFAPLKRSQTELLVQKACELGVTRLQPVITAHTQVESLRRDRLEAIAMEAIEQSEQLAPPNIAAPQKLFDALGSWDQGIPLVVAAEAGSTSPLPAVLQALGSGPSRLGLLVGPQGGLSPEEFQHLRQMSFTRFAGLGPRILKAETACIASLAIVQALVGDGSQAPNFRG